MYFDGTVPLVQATPTSPDSGGGWDAAPPPAADEQGMSEDELFTNLTAYYEQFAPGTKTEEQLRKMAGKVKIVSPSIRTRHPSPRTTARRTAEVPSVSMGHCRHTGEGNACVWGGGT